MDILLITRASLVFAFRSIFRGSWSIFTDDYFKNLFFAAFFYHNDTKFSNIGLVIIVPRNTNTTCAGDKLGKMSV